MDAEQRPEGWQERERRERGNGAPAASGEASTGELVRALVQDSMLWVKQEAQLLRHELDARITLAQRAAMLAGSAATLAVIGLLALVTGASLGLAVVMPVWGAFLISGGTLVVVAGVILLVARTQRPTERQPDMGSILKPPAHGRKEGR